MSTAPSSPLPLVAYLVAVTWATVQSNRRWMTLLVIVPFSELMPTRAFATEGEARRVGILATQHEIDDILKAA
jgi:hypothetical protein